MVTANDVLASRFEATTYPDRESWLAERHTGIGASEAAAVLGVSRWQSPLGIYAAKTGLDVDHEPNEAMEWGLRLEETIAEAFEEKTGRRLLDLGRYTLLRSLERPWQYATLDRIQFDLHNRNGRSGPGILEIKCSMFEEGWDEHDELPIQYQVQVQHQLAVTGLAWGTLAVLIAGSKFRWKDVQRNERFIASMTRREEFFWNEHVAKRVPPEAGALDSDVLRALYPAAEAENMRLGPEEVALVERLAELKARMAQDDAEAEAIKNVLKQTLGTAATGFCPDGTEVRWRNRRGYTEEKPRTVEPGRVFTIVRPGAR